MASRDERRSACQRGYGRRWQRESKAFLAIHPWCVRLGDGCGILATLVDHIQPHRGDMALFWRVENWQSLCDHCHSHHKQAIEARALAGQRDHRGRLIL